MGYTLPDSEIRLINIDGSKPIVKKAWAPAEWWCDPCALSSRRYRVLHPGGWLAHHWFQVLTPDDSAQVRFLKYRAAGLYMKIRTTKVEADRRWREVNA